MIKSKENNLIKTELIELSSSMKQHKIKPHNPKEGMNFYFLLNLLYVNFFFFGGGGVVYRPFS